MELLIEVETMEKMVMLEQVQVQEQLLLPLIWERVPLEDKEQTVLVGLVVV